jgi:hypothetical protein
LQQRDAQVQVSHILAGVNVAKDKHVLAHFLVEK